MKLERYKWFPKLKTNKGIEHLDICIVLSCIEVYNIVDKGF